MIRSRDDPVPDRNLVYHVVVDVGHNSGIPLAHKGPTHPTTHRRIRAHAKSDSRHCAPLASQALFVTRRPCDPNVNGGKNLLCTGFGTGKHVLQDTGKVAN